MWNDSYSIPNETSLWINAKKVSVSRMGSLWYGNLMSLKLNYIVIIRKFKLVQPQTMVFLSWGPMIGRC